MTQTLDLDAYLARIGYTGPRAPTLDALRAIQGQHAESIAFENLNPFLGWPVPLDLPSLEQKLVHDRRGGYCFEQNALLGHALRALGFRVTDLAARVLWGQPEGAITPRTHMLLRIDLDGQAYLVDAGFGGQTPTGPLRLEPDVEQPTPHEPFRLVQAGDFFTLQSRTGDTWSALYRFDLQEHFPPDYEICNYYLSTHPSSHFRTALKVARPAADRRYALLNRQLTVRHLDGRTERRVLESPAELRRTLEDVFLLHVPPGPELDAAFDRLG
jgi:N-hydroxyarylamine O-acetyltransferase